MKTYSHIFLDNFRNNFEILVRPIITKDFMIQEDFLSNGDKTAVFGEEVN